MNEEINSLDDLLSLRLLRDASARNQDEVSDTASHRIMMTEDGSIADRSGMLHTGSISADPTTESFYTAEGNTNIATHRRTLSLADDFSEKWNGLMPWRRLRALNNPNNDQHRRILAEFSRKARKLPPWKAGPKLMNMAQN